MPFFSFIIDEIDKFEEMGAKMGSTSPNLPPSLEAPNYCSRPMNYRGIAPPPIPPKPQNLMDGRTSCPPNPFSYNDNNNNNNGQQKDFINSYRCISPSVDIWKRTQQNNNANGNFQKWEINLGKFIILDKKSHRNSVKKISNFRLQLQQFKTTTIQQINYE